MRRLLSVFALLTGAFMASSVTGSSVAHASPVAKPALNSIAAIVDTSKSGVVKVRRGGRRGGYGRGGGGRYYGGRGYRGRSYGRRSYRGRSYGRRSYGKRYYGGRSYGRRSYGKRYYGGRRYGRRYYRGRRYRNGSYWPYALGGLALGLYGAPYYYDYDYGGGRCDYWARRCADNWGYGNNDYYGCLRYHGCR
jgi:hypothetical protein